MKKVIFFLSAAALMQSAIAQINGVLTSQNFRLPVELRMCGILSVKSS